MTMRTTVQGDRSSKIQLAGEMNDNATSATRSSRARGDYRGRRHSVALRHNVREFGGLTAC